MSYDRRLLADGESHVLLTAKTPVSTRGVRLQEWLGQMVNDIPRQDAAHSEAQGPAVIPALASNSWASESSRAPLSSPLKP